MTDSCSTCFYARSPLGVLSCAKSTPQSIGTTSAIHAAAQWLEVDPAWWCGDFSATDPHVYAGNTTGPAGPTGSTGPAGTTPNTTFDTTNTFPTPTGGNDGDVWVNSASATMTTGSTVINWWKRSGGTWTKLMSVSL